jgi:biotin synthase
MDICTYGENMNNEYKIIDEIKISENITLEQLALLLTTENQETLEYLRSTARKTSNEIYGNEIYIRGLIEFTNYCKNDCIYCGIRKSNKNADRYRLTEGQILDCCKAGYELGFRTFVLQGGEDAYFTDERICEIVSQIKKNHPDCAVTLSIGEKSRESYQKYFDAGADRYLLRHETANKAHYEKIHPKEMSFENRIRCLYDLKEIGYQVGCGFMVGSPYQTVETLYDDLQFIRKLQPHMVGIGPFIPQHDTPFGNEKPGTLDETLRLLSIIRLISPHVLLPATTALGTIHPLGREKGIQAGANVVMPNLSPVNVRDKYMLYDNKICTGDEAAECRFCMQRRMETIGYQVVVDRGDCRSR